MELPKGNNPPQNKFNTLKDPYYLKSLVGGRMKRPIDYIFQSEKFHHFFLIITFLYHRITINSSPKGMVSVLREEFFYVPLCMSVIRFWLSSQQSFIFKKCFYNAIHINEI